jgi:hypothetical protein
MNVRPARATLDSSRTQPPCRFADSETVPHNWEAYKRAEAAAQAEAMSCLWDEHDAMRYLLDVVRGPRSQLKFPTDESPLSGHTGGHGDRQRWVE